MSKFWNGCRRKLSEVHACRFWAMESKPVMSKPPVRLKAGKLRFSSLLPPPPPPPSESPRRLSRQRCRSQGAGSRPNHPVPYSIIGPEGWEATCSNFASCLRSKPAVADSNIRSCCSSIVVVMRLAARFGQEGQDST